MMKNKERQHKTGSSNTNNIELFVFEKLMNELKKVFELRLYLHCALVIRKSRNYEGVVICIRYFTLISQSEVGLDLRYMRQ